LIRQIIVRPLLKIVRQGAARSAENNRVQIAVSSERKKGSLVQNSKVVGFKAFFLDLIVSSSSEIHDVVSSRDEAHWQTRDGYPSSGHGPAVQTFNNTTLAG
jgi:hypothetical protein